MDYEVVIPAAPKDFNKLPYVINSLRYLNPQPRGFHVIAPWRQLGDIPWRDFNYLARIHHDKDVLPGLNPEAAHNFRRPQWVFQQFVKLFNNVTNTDRYLIVDSDLIVNRQVDLFNEQGKPIFFLGVDQNHSPYFRCSKETFGFGREYPFSFISEIMMFDKRLIPRLLDEFRWKHGTFDSFTGMAEGITELYAFVTQRACEDWIPADYEIYGNFVEKYFPDLYVKKHIKTNLKGKMQQNWSDEELRAYINDMKDKDYDFFTAHTWL
jgi:hypothetical protein